ncbi:M28 family metallopeptidase [Pseudozobellia thermophila]|uniref:Peptidase family M28 n=1 Tax=Pseudozobellia thermophila TaxID=192903 RepID=A0A1M6BRG0_9FLAO|nr:M20/M25/M40 family metallo-hydrolase [Pseudozobellia thermophila]SHI51319.1 Peptidase family M28 [Pseudozobellia thermophila]
MGKAFILCLFLMGTAQGFSQAEITEEELYDHISFLTSADNAGRYPGSKTNKALTNYIVQELKSSGVEKPKRSYRQKFTAELRVSGKTQKKPKVKTWNIIGVLRGNHPTLRNEYIVLGAHYDHLGYGGPSSKSDKKNAVHPGADDNASGTAALLEIAERLAHNKDRLQRSVIFVAFGAEEQGLLGSKHFVANPPVPLSQIKLMINMDMVGRLNDQKHVYMGGAGTFPGGERLMAELGKKAGLNPVIHAGSVGGSDHVSFYKKGIPVLGMHTGGHPQYHTPEDTLDLINIEGEKMVCDYIYETILALAGSDRTLQFIAQD